MRSIIEAKLILDIFSSKYWHCLSKAVGGLLFFAPEKVCPTLRTLFIRFTLHFGSARKRPERRDLILVSALQLQLSKRSFGTAPLLCIFEFLFPPPKKKSLPDQYWRSVFDPKSTSTFDVWFRSYWRNRTFFPQIYLNSTLPPFTPGGNPSSLGVDQKNAGKKRGGGGPR